MVPGFPLVGGVPPNGIPPKRALPIAPSADCHSQSTPPNSSQWDWTRSHIRLNSPSLLPPLEGAVDGAVVPQGTGQLIPLAT